MVAFGFVDNDSIFQQRLVMLVQRNLCLFYRMLVATGIYCWSRERIRESKDSGRLLIMSMYFLCRSSSCWGGFFFLL